MTADYGNMARLRELMMSLGVRRLVAKRLSDNDNSKNQIYLGSDFEALNVLPFGTIRGTATARNKILKAELNFRWLLPDGTHSRAPSAQLILYPQYPEVRMSGFLKGSRNAPSGLMSARRAGRILFLGIDDVGVITGAVVDRTDDLAKEFEAAIAGQKEQIFYELTIGVAVEDTQNRLLAELKRIHQSGWINSKRLRADGSLTTCTAPQCGGYTLEAELGITPNGRSDPDYLGWEIKQYAVTNLGRPDAGGRITLMTPEPTGGYYGSKGAEAFLRKYGYDDRRGREDRINFGGLHRVGSVTARTQMSLVLDGYDALAGKLTDPTRGITLLDKAGSPAAIWHYAGLIAHWGRKHARAAYIASTRRIEPQRQYRYASSVLLCQETDFLRFLKQMATGQVYYDPGIKLEEASSQRARVKSRSQFRVNFGTLPLLYARTERVTL